MVRFFSNRFGTLALFFLLVPAAFSYPGKVVVKKNEVRWGQYKNIRGVRAVEAPAGQPDEWVRSLWRWPASGASAVVLRCQSPGVRFFASDGESIPPQNLERIRQDILAANALDMLPILLVFDPSLECQLDSPEAYSGAIESLVSGLDSVGWYLLAISDRLDHPDWTIQDPAMDPVSIAQGLAKFVKERHPQLVVAAGSGSPTLNERLMEEEGGIDVLMGRTRSLGDGDRWEVSDRYPIIQTVRVGDLTEADLGSAVDRVGFRRIGDSFPYGFALLFDPGTGKPEAELDRTLEQLKEIVDRSQKSIAKALPPSSDMNATLDPKEAEEGFVSLFNGRDLSGWVPITQPGNFVVEDGVITIDRYKGGWLRSWEEYDDFILRVEYWIEESGNSGLFIRAPLVGRCSRIGFEFQIMGQSPDVPITDRITGSLYDIRPPRGVYIRPGEWNEVEIRCVGTEVEIHWNGKLAHHFHYEEVDKMRNRATSGYIGLQDHYDPVKFRNLRIKRLN